MNRAPNFEQGPCRDSASFPFKLFLLFLETPCLTEALHPCME